MIYKKPCLRKCCKMIERWYQEESEVAAAWVGFGWDKRICLMCEDKYNYNMFYNLQKKILKIFIYFGCIFITWFLIIGK